MNQAKKRSRKRDAILACLQQSQDHPTAEGIYRRLKVDIPDLSLGTVYRNLTVFRKEGTIVSLGTVGGLERFDCNTAPHAHFICRCCHAIVDVPQPSMSAEALEQAARIVGGSVETCTVTFTGLCKACQSHADEKKV